MNKYLSRKFIVTVLSSIAGICLSLSQLEGRAGTICAVVSAIMLPAIYVVTEGRIDAKAVNDFSDILTRIAIKENAKELINEEEC